MEIDSDLVFARASGLVGGTPGQDTESNASINQFQARYFIQHDEEGPRGSTVTTLSAPTRPVTPLPRDACGGCASTRTSILPMMVILFGGLILRRRRVAADT